MAPVVKELEKHSNLIESIVCVTAQHREMLDQVLSLFEIEPQIDLDLMERNQTLASLTEKVVGRLTKVIVNIKPDIVLLQGDTTTAMVAGLASLYQKIPVGHVEAGLRTYDRYSPFPEEINRPQFTLAGVSTPLPLHPTSMFALLGVPALINDNYGLRMTVVTSNHPLKSIPQARSIPGRCREKVLQSPRRDVCRQCNRLDALTFEVGQLSVEVSLQVRPLVAAAETIVEFSQKCPQFTSRVLNSFRIHVRSPYKYRTYKNLSTQAA